MLLVIAFMRVIVQRRMIKILNKLIFLFKKDLNKSSTFARKGFQSHVDF